MLPSALLLPAISAIPVNVPVVSKKSRKNRIKTTDIKAVLVTAEKSSAKAALATGGAAAMPPNSAIPDSHPTRLNPRMVNRMPPRMPRAASPAITSSPARLSSTAGLPRLPRRSSVSGSSTTSPMPCRPIIARNRPIPAVMPRRRLAGMAPISQLRNRDRENRRNNTDATNTAASACCQLNPCPSTSP